MVDDLPAVPLRHGTSRRPRVGDLEPWAHWLKKCGGKPAALVGPFLAGQDRNDTRGIHTIREAVKAALSQPGSKLDSKAKERLLAFLGAFPERPGAQVDEPRDQRVQFNLTKTELEELKLAHKRKGVDRAGYIRDAVLDSIVKDQRAAARQTKGES